MRTLILYFMLIPAMYRAQIWTWDSVTPPVTWYLSKLIKDNHGNVYRSSANELRKCYTRKGKVNWAITLPKNVNISGAVFDNESCFLTGSFTGSCVMGNKTYSANSTDGWVARFDLDRTLLWFNVFTGPNAQGCGEICLMGNNLGVVGSAVDTVKYLGSVVQNTFIPNSGFLFVSKISRNGQLMRITAACTDSTVHNNMYIPQSGGDECASDEYGNIYVRAVFEGHTTIGNYHFDHPLHETREVILKFDSELKLSYCSIIGGDCDYFCYPHHDLHVNTRSQAMLLRNYGYNDSYASLLVLAADGSVDTTVMVTRDEEGSIYDMDLDSCDNIYLTGYGSTNGNVEPHYFFMTNYQLSPQYQVNWRKNDTVSFLGINILALSYNDCIVFANYADGTSGSLKHLQAPILTRCKTLTSHLENSKPPELRVYPNPFGNLIRIETTSNSQLKIFDGSGCCILQFRVEDGVHEIDTKYFPKGLYFLQYHNACFKLVKF